MVHVGQKLWLVPSDRRGEPREVTVAKVGRKWADIAPSYFGRMSIETLALDGGQYESPGQCFEDRAAYEAKRLLDQTWSDFRRLVSETYRTPNVTIENIRAAASLISGVKP